MARPTLLKFYLESNDDEEITCLLCGFRKCDLSFVAKGDGSIRIIGVHERCVERHEKSQTKTSGG